MPLLSLISYFEGEISMMTRISAQLENIARVFAGSTEDFVSKYQERAVALFSKAIELGDDPKSLELVYIPAKNEYGFYDLVNKFHQTRVARGYKGETHYQWGPLWKDKANVFGDYGLKDEAQLQVLPRGDGKDGLFFTDMAIAEQIEAAKELFAKNANTDYMSPVAYVCAQILRASESENGTKSLLDFGGGDWTFTRFPQFSAMGFIETAGDRVVPCAGICGDGLFELGGSGGGACSCRGPRVAVGE